MRAGSLVVAAALVFSGAALADRGALSVDVSAGGVATSVPALFAATPKSTVSLDVSAWVGLRYALKNHFEFSVTGYFEPPVTVFQNDIQLVAGSGTYPGSTRHHLMRFGAQAGARAVLGMRFRLHLGVELGWCQQLYSMVQHFDVSRADGAVDYGLSLPDVSLPNLVFSPLVGVEWAVGNQWSVSVIPRAQVMLGNGITWAVIVPFQFSWSWYL